MSSTYESVRQFVKAMQAGDTATVDAIVDDAINRCVSRTITPDEYNALLDATMMPGLGTGGQQ